MRSAATCSRLALRSLAVVLAGCSLVEGYPAPGAEICANGLDDDLDGRADCADVACHGAPECDEAMHCHNGVDDDRNGLTDCMDPACDGQCPEDTLAECSNGRDDDGDGYRDWIDPRCWPFAHLAVTRCPRIPGGAVTLAPSLDDWHDAWPSHLGTPSAAVVVPDANDPSRSVIGVANGGDYAELDALVPSEGALAGTHVVVPVYVDGAAGVYFEARGPGGDEWFVWALSVRGGFVLAPDFASVQHASTPIAAGWYTVETTIATDLIGTSVTATLRSRADGSMVARVLPVVIPWPRVGEIVPYVRLDAVAGGSAFIGTTVITRLDGSSCTSIPSGLEGYVFGAARSPDGTICVPAYANVTGQWHVGSFRAASVGDDAFVFHETDSSEWTWNASPAWDPDRASFVGARPDLAGMETDVVQSADCSAWSMGGEAYATGMDPLASVTAPGVFPGLGRAVVRARVAGPIEHELWYADDGAMRSLGFARSTTGAAGSFALTRSVVVESIVQPRPMTFDPDVDWRRHVAVTVIGGDHLFFVSRQEAIGPGHVVWRSHAFLESTAGGAPFVELSSLVLGPSSAPGATDAVGPERVYLLELDHTDEMFEAWLLHHSGNGLHADIDRLVITPPGT
jgi:hypothetical protein